MRILSWNVNGLRAIYKKDFLGWLEKSQADIVCLQEVKAQAEQLAGELLSPFGYRFYLNPAVRKGYSGVAVYTKQAPKKIESALEIKKFDQQGRMLKLEYSEFALINFYIPNGARDKRDMKYKLAVFEQIFKYLKKQKHKKIILVGDFNIAHKPIDLARPDENENSTMFTPLEREKIDRLIKLGFVDSFRHFYKDGGHYSWWPYFFNARQRNLGWRIDYIFVAKPLLRQAKGAFIQKEVMGSDHCPVGLDIRLKLV